MSNAQQQGYEHWRLWTQDESRCGLLPIVRRRITARGVQPLLPAAYRFESLYLSGAVEPLTGQSFFLELPLLNTAGFQLFLEHFAATDPTTFHLLLLDNGAFHKAQALRLPPNVALRVLSPLYPRTQSHRAAVARPQRLARAVAAHHPGRPLDSAHASPPTLLPWRRPLVDWLPVSPRCGTGSEWPVIMKKPY